MRRDAGSESEGEGSHTRTHVRTHAAHIYSIYSYHCQTETFYLYHDSGKINE